MKISSETTTNATITNEEITTIAEIIGAAAVIAMEAIVVQIPHFAQTIDGKNRTSVTMHNLADEQSPEEVIHLNNSRTIYHHLCNFSMNDYYEYENLRIQCSE